jgi:hypothetical protein
VLTVSLTLGGCGRDKMVGESKVQRVMDDTFRSQTQLTPEAYIREVRARHFPENIPIWLAHLNSSPAGHLLSQSGLVPSPVVISDIPKRECLLSSFTKTTCSQTIHIPQDPFYGLICGHRSTNPPACNNGVSSKSLAHMGDKLPKFSLF